MDGLPVTIRLLDPPVQEFLPDRTGIAARVAAAEAAGGQPDAHNAELLDAMNRIHEENPVLGLRGVRLGLVVPGLVAMQVRRPPNRWPSTRGSPRAEIMVGAACGRCGGLRLCRARNRTLTQQGRLRLLGGSLGFRRILRAKESGLHFTAAFICFRPVFSSSDRSMAWARTGTGW